MNEEGSIEPISEWPPPCGDSPCRSDPASTHGSHSSVIEAAAYTGPSLTRSGPAQTEICHPEAKKACHRKEVEEPTANIGLARWWRRQSEMNRAVILRGKEGKTTTWNPNTLLRYIARTAEAQQFMKSEVRRLSEVIKVLDGSLLLGDVHAALGSYLEKLQDWQGAEWHLEAAVKLKPDARDYQWLLHKVRRLQHIDSMQRQAVHRLPRRLPAALEFQQVERRTADDLSFPEFFFRYAMSSIPVVFEGLAYSMTHRIWDIEHIRDVAGDCQATVKRLVTDSAEWARMEDCHITTVREFIDSLPAQNTLPPEKQTYLFDWSLPIHCPTLAQELTIPKYFAEDFLQRTNPGTLYHDSWPSLFIAPTGLRSELHVDAFGSNFWMALFEGRKRWVFFNKEDVPLLYPDYEHSMDPVFEVNLAEPDLKKHPLLSLTKPMECILQPGDVLFVPAGCPHRVQNLAQSLAISANFVDLSNLGFVKRELSIHGLQDQRAAELLDQLQSPQLCLKMNSAVQDMDWRRFKQWPKDYRAHNY